MIPFRRVAWLFAVPIGSLVLACSAGGDGSGGTDPLAGSDTSGGSGDAGGYLDGTSSDAGFNIDGGLDIGGGGPDIGADAFFADDPPPGVCGDSGVVPKTPGGTPECPDDKNREGCPCLKEGDTATCWPGFRKNRNRGVCHDGTTTCKKVKETTLGWGPCEGYQLPTGATGKEACVCFSGGQWTLDNLSPCFISGAGGAVKSAVSTLPNYDASGKAAPACPTDGKKPSVAWTHTSVKVDCSGHFKLCYTLKAGDSTKPLATDCVVTTQCAEGDYVTPNVVQKWGDLPAWESTDAACAAKFASSGGYGEMSVVGTSVECDHVEKVFNRVQYCPLYCNDAKDPRSTSDPVCKSCGAGGGGSF